VTSYVNSTLTVLVGTAWTGTAPAAGNPTISGTINGSTDFSDHCRQASFSSDIDMQDFTTFGDAGFKVNKPGLIGGTIELELFQDFDASEVHAFFTPKALAKTLIYVDLKPTSASRGATNPSFVAACYINSYDPFGVAVGDAVTTTISLTITGTYGTLTS
jgi:hypothetical protein